LTTALYVMINWALVHALGPQGVAATPLPFSVVLNKIGGALPAILFAITAMITVSSATNAQIMGSSRVLYALAADGLMPRIFATVNKGGSPVIAMLLSVPISIGLAMSGAFGLVFGLVGTLNTLCGVLVDISFFALRRNEPNLARPFRA